MEKVTPTDRLRQLMQEQNLKQADILKACKPFCEQYGVKIGRNDLSQYISGKVRFPGNKKLMVLSLALDVSEVWLMGYDVPRNPKTPMTESASPPSALNQSEDSNLIASTGGNCPRTGFLDYLVSLGYQITESPDDDRLYLRLKEYGRRIYLSSNEMEKIEAAAKEKIDLEILDLLSDGRHNI